MFLASLVPHPSLTLPFFHPLPPPASRYSSRYNIYISFCSRLSPNSSSPPPSRSITSLASYPRFLQMWTARSFGTSKPGIRYSVRSSPFSLRSFLSFFHSRVSFFSFSGRSYVRYPLSLFIFSFSLTSTISYLPFCYFRSVALRTILSKPENFKDEPMLYEKVLIAGIKCQGGHFPLLSFFPFPSYFPSFIPFLFPSLFFPPCFLHRPHPHL